MKVKNTAAGEGSWYVYSSPLVHGQCLPVTHGLPLPVLTRSEGESPKLQEGEKLKSLLIHRFGCWFSRGSRLGCGGLGVKTRVDFKSWNLTWKMPKISAEKKQFLMRFKPQVLVQAWHGILPQRGSADVGSACTDRSTWRVQAKMKMQGTKQQQLGHRPLLIPPCLPSLLPHQVCLWSNKPWDNGPQRRRAEGQELMSDSAWRQPGYAVNPVHDRRKTEEGKLCQSCITGKTKAGSSTRFERTLINRADRWSPVVPRPYENPFPFLACQSLFHSLPLSELVSHCALHRRFCSLADSSTHSREVSQAGASSHQPVCLSSPFTCCLFSIYTQRAHPLARPFACFVRGDGDANARKCMLSVICATRFSPPGYLPCIMYLILSYSDLGPEISSKGKSKFKSCRCAWEWLGQKKGPSSCGSCFATSPFQCFGQTPLSPRGGGGEVCLYSCTHREELPSAFIRKALAPQCKRFFCLLVKDSASGYNCRRQTNPLQHLCRLGCPSEKRVAVSRKN